MRHTGKLLLGLLAVLSLSLPNAVGRAGAAEVFQYFPETGHYVDGDWLTWFAAHGGVDVIGAPRTEDYAELGRLQQYFRTVRLEWDCGPDGKQVCKLHPGNLGEQILGKTLDLPPDQITAGIRTGGTRTFSGSNYSVSGGFLDLFDKLGGVEFFGYPLSGQVIEAGQTVQWFQRARIERQADGSVKLSPLGDYWIDTLKRVPLITILPLPAPEAAPVVPAAAPALTGVIAYETADGQIMLANADGSAGRALTEGVEPAISPDGSRVAFIRLTGETPGLWVYDLRTGTERFLVNVYGIRSPFWSPDGTKIAILKAKQDPTRVNDPITRRPGWALVDHYSVGVVDVATGQVTDVPSQLYSSFPSFSPDGSRILFDGNDGLYIVPADGAGEPVLIDNTHRTFSQPVWSPDGTRIAFVFQRDSNYDIAVMNVDGTGFALLTQSPHQNRQSNNVAPVWSPDGTRIAFLSDRSGTWQIYAVNPDTGVIQPMLTHDLGVNFSFKDERAVSWGPGAG